MYGRKLNVLDRFIYFGSTIIRHCIRVDEISALVKKAKRVCGSKISILVSVIEGIRRTQMIWQSVMPVCCLICYTPVRHLKDLDVGSENT